MGMFRAYQLGDQGFINSIDQGFLYFIALVNLFTSSPFNFLFAICLFISICFYMVGVRFLNSPFYLSLYTVLLLSSSFYLAYNINILRQGMASAVAMLLMALLVNYRGWFLRILASPAAILFHKIGGLLTIPMVLGTRRPGMVYFWLAAVFISLFSGLYAPFAIQILPTDYVDYATGNFNYRVGFRPDFVAFSSIPLLLLLILPFRKMSPNTRWIFNAYVLMNGVGHLMNFISYADRFLIASWVLLPLLSTLVIKDINERGYTKTENKRFFSALVILGLLLVNSFFYLRGF